MAGNAVDRRRPAADAADLDAKAAGSGGIDLGRRIVDGGAAEGAGRRGSEPGVDALGVEGVAARGEETEIVVWTEVGEADGAVEGLGLRLGFLQ